MAVYRTDAEVPAEWQVGDVLLDKYEVREILGRGGFGIVYKVYHRSFDIELAVKCPLAERLERKRGQQDFIREASNWVQLGLHPHVVTCHYVRTIGGIPRVFAEYVAGGSLHDWIENRTLYEGGHEVALERMLDIAIQMAWGLHYAHQRGLVHQDMKPHNVMMTPDGVAKVSDFGLAKARDLVTISQQVTVMGRTLAYCSPEQGMSQKVTRKADIWSWGLGFSIGDGTEGEPSRAISDHIVILMVKMTPYPKGHYNDDNWRQRAPLPSWTALTLVRAGGGLEGRRRNNS